MTVVDTTTGEVLSGEVIEELDAEAARALTDRIVHSTTLAAQLVAEAWQGRAWKSLGYKSWEQYADAELPTLGTNSANRHVLLVGLRNVGMSTRAIAAATGLHHSTVARGVANATPAAVTGTDGKQYDPVRETHRETKSTTVEFDPGDAATGDGAEEPSSLDTSPGSPSDVEPSPAAPSADPVEDGTRTAPSTGSPAPAIARGLKQVTTFFTAWRPEQVRALNDPELDRTVDLLICVAADWFEEFSKSEPSGLTVIEGGRQ